jgi:hypothetical protein
LTQNQRIRAELLFTNYPLLHKAYKHTLEFRNIYEETSRELTKKNSKLDRENQTIRNDRFNTAANSLKYHLETILNFIKRHTNAIAESFNSKIKLQRPPKGCRRCQILSL